MRAKRICIVTVKHLSYNPRVLKEADAFFKNGYQVSVVTINNHFHQERFDKEIMKSRKWKLKTVNFRKEDKKEKWLWFYLSFKHKFFSALAKFSFHFGIAERAALKGYEELVTLARKEKADFYLAHHAEALAVGYQAARNSNAILGFDAEDFHTGMNEYSPESTQNSLISFLEAKYLPHYSYLTATSKGIGEAYARKYSLKKIRVILNVFPLWKSQHIKLNSPVRFYWYSQVIGPGRGLEILLKAASQIAEPFEIHLRGTFHSSEYENSLRTRIKNLNLLKKVFFHEPILAESIIHDAAQYDVGLALESDVSINRNICVTNKIFAYLMAGLAIVGTDTYGQKDIFSNFKHAVRICRINDAESLAAAMNGYIVNSETLLSAKFHARYAANEHFNWEKESEKLLSGVENEFANSCRG